ncbi:venom allergen 3-like [Harmonia axyridis]|uniref:venom allergen 3-like n=1 Tax=Harmonia axyridis TaxID=115357 RepID=UPI001E27871A|nr:venom allergen 3-like [Harmonia axyridis]
MVTPTVPIYLLLTQLMALSTAKQVPLLKYRDLLTRNFSKRWLSRMSERQSATNPYCNLCCLNITTGGVRKDCGYHTLCRYTQPHCKGYMGVAFSEADKYTILDAHNTLRNGKAVLVGAANMRRLEWDDELAEVAEMWAAQCNPAHDRCRDVERFPVGQNIAVDYASKSNYLGFVRDWFRNTNHSPSSPEYTQLVWAESYVVGCARAVFQSTDSPDRPADVVYKEILVCNYGPAGNIPGQPVYAKGTPCSACPAGTECEAEYPSLCARRGDDGHAYKTTRKYKTKEEKKGVTEGGAMAVFDPDMNFNGSYGIYSLSNLILYPYIVGLVYFDY